MIKKLSIILILALIFSYVQSEGIPINFIPHPGPVEDVVTPTYEISLDDKPYNRWDHIVPIFKPAIQKFIRLMDAVGIPETAYETLALFAQTQSSYHEFVEELKGIGAVADVNWKKLLLANFLYDISSILPHANLCSSIVAIQEDGTCIHGRNLDFFPWALLSKDAAYIKVMKGGKHVATFHQLIGASMVLSGVRNGSFSVTVDTRKYMLSKDKQATISQLVENIMVKKYTPCTFLTRNLLQQDGITFEQAREAFMNTDTTAAIYYIVAGLDAGLAIEKNPVGYNAYWQVGKGSNLSDGEWYYVQTNYDRYQNPGLDDRVTPACKRLSSIGQDNINLDKLKTDVMSKYPTFNIASIYTSSLYPTTGFNNLKLLYGNIEDLKTSSDMMDTDIIPDSQFIAELLGESYSLPEEQIQEAVEYMSRIAEEQGLYATEQLFEINE